MSTYSRPGRNVLYCPLC